MKKALCFLLVLSLGAALDRMLSVVPATSAAGGGEGAGAEKCAAKNGDVNADGNVDLSDAVTVLGNLFLGNPTALVPLCATPGPGGLPATGQSVCYGIVEGQGWVPVPCGEATCPGVPPRPPPGDSLRAPGVISHNRPRRSAPSPAVPPASLEMWLA